MRKTIGFTAVCTGLMLLVGCGYHRPKAVLPPPTEGQSQTISGVLMRVKPLRDFECSYYFDNRLVSRGIQPLQLYINNDTDSYFVLDGKDISLPLMGRRDVGGKFYKNVVGRSLVWFVGSLIYWKIFLPVLLLDSLLCMQANKEIGTDLASLGVNPKQKIVIEPRTRLHKVLFVPVDQYHHHMTIPLKEQEKDTVLTFRF